MTISFIGDIMPGGVLPYLDSNPLGQDFLSSFLASDVRVATLETALGDALPFDEVKMKGRANIIYSPVDSANLLLQMGITLVSLANNHVFDLGIEGLKVTIEWLKEHGIMYCGAGMDIEEASKPAIIERDGMKIAFIACCSYNFPHVGYVPIATTDTPGIAPLELDSVCKQIRNAKSCCNHVIVLPHWGREYSYYPSKENVKMAREMIKAGADLIIGTHTHCPQPNVKFRKGEVFFSLGNGLFPDFYVNEPRPIWYPDSNTDLSTISSTFDYPFPVTEPMLRIWKPMSRYGIMVTANILPAKISSSAQFIYLTDNNILTLRHNPALNRKLKLMGILTRSPFYNEGRIINLPLRIIRKLYRTVKSLFR